MHAWFELTSSPAVGTVLAVLAAAGVFTAGRALLPKDPAAAAVGAAVFAASLRVASPSLAVAAVAVWALAAWLTGRRRLAIALAGVAVALAPRIWALGSGDPLDAVIPMAPVAVGAGVLGAGFGAMTGLPRATVVLVAIVVGALVDPIAFLALCAVGCAVIPSAVVRVVGSDRRARVALAAGVPLVAAALLATPF